MNLFDVTLDLGSFAQGTADYTISSIPGNRISCDNLSGRVAEYGGGTIWFRTGNSAGQFGRIKSALANSVDIQDSYPDGFAVGDEITIGSWQDFDTNTMINAINSVLRMYKIIDVNTDLVYDPETEYYELPEDVTEDIRRVQLQRKHWTGNQWMESHYWKVQHPRTLFLYDKRKLMFEPDANIALTYVKLHGAVGKDDEINAQVDPLYLRYMSWLYLCRHLIQNTHKDNLVSTDMFNEAKIYERDYSHLPNKALNMKTFTFPQW